MIAYGIAVMLLLLIFPLVSIPFALIGFFYDSKLRLLYSMVLGIAAGLIAYNFAPPISFDLYRHHEDVLAMAQYNSWANIPDLLFESSEPIQALILNIIAGTGNPNLLQFIIVTFGYAILLFCIGDYAKRSNAKKSSLLLALLLTLSSFTAINFFSGLWNYIAIIIFALAFYLDVYRGKSKWISYPLYLITPFIHLSMVFPVLLIVIFKLTRNRINPLSVTLSLTAFLAPPLILSILSTVTNIPALVQIESMYRAYFINGDQFLNLYGGSVMAMELLKGCFYGIIALLFYRTLRVGGHVTLYKTAAFVMLLTFTTFVMVISSVVFLRFILLVQIIGVPLIIYVLDSGSRKLRFTLALIIIMLSLIFCVYQFMTLQGLDFGPVSPKGVFTTSWQMLR